MKIRLGFVTNSSSSSYVCDICGNDASGWDISLKDAGMVVCTNDHTFCEDHTLGELETPEDDEDYSDWRYEVDPEFCPICKFKHLLPEDYLELILKDTKITKEIILSSMASRFKNYETFKDFLKG